MANRMKRHWTALYTGNTIQAVSTSTAVDVLAILSTDLGRELSEHSTITRLLIDIQSRPPVGDIGNLQVAFGLIVARDEAIAAGPGSLPVPGSDHDAGWLWEYRFPALTAPYESSAGVFSEHPIREKVDLGAMRRFDGNQSSLAFISRNTSGVVIVEYNMWLRVLVLET